MRPMCGANCGTISLADATRRPSAKGWLGCTQAPDRHGGCIRISARTKPPTGNFRRRIPGRNLSAARTGSRRRGRLAPTDPRPCAGSPRPCRGRSLRGDRPGAARMTNVHCCRRQWVSIGGSRKMLARRSGSDARAGFRKRGADMQRYGFGLSRAVPAQGAPHVRACG